MGSKSIPEGWLEFAAVGRAIPRTRIVCFKVPLKEEISRALPAPQRFTPQMLMAAIPNLVGVIDVTNTSRYYNKQVFLNCGILHEKILCPGHVIPPPQVVSAFQNAMDHFWNSAESLGKLVGVHCTHGVNRTGYLVCRYLIERCGFHPEEAIKLFGESRGHPIQRQNYVDDLKRLKPQSHPPSNYHRDECRQRGQQPMGRGVSEWQRSYHDGGDMWNEGTSSWTRSGRMHRMEEGIGGSNFTYDDRMPPSYGRQQNHTSGNYGYYPSHYPIDASHSNQRNNLPDNRNSHHGSYSSWATSKRFPSRKHH